MSEDDFRYLVERAVTFYEKQGIKTLDDYHERVDDICSFLVNNPPKEFSDE